MVSFPQGKIYIPCICTYLLQKHAKEEAAMRFYNFSEHAQGGRSERSEVGACAVRPEHAQGGWNVYSEAGACAVRLERG